MAEANSYFGILPPSYPAQDDTRAIDQEERALDSYYNVLFSLVRFWEEHGHVWPQRVTIVSHAFKRERLVDGHCVAIGYPLSRVGFVGVDPPGMLDGSNEAAVAGAAHAVAEWTEDPHGVGESLAGKRIRRNPWAVPQDLFVSEESRRLSGVKTVVVDGVEVLDPDATQPWSSSSQPS